MTIAKPQSERRPARVIVLIVAAVIVIAGVSGAACNGPTPRRVFLSTLDMAPDFRDDSLGILIERPDLQQPPKDAFPASFWAEACSGTLVGAKAFLSASHCFEDVVDVVITFRGQRYEGKCDTATRWSKGRITADVALCAMTVPVPVPVFETPSFDVRGLKRGDKVILTGSGGSVGAHVRPDSYLVGTATVDFIDGNRLTTKNGAWTTPGDSGGADYYCEVGGARRSLVSVNSKVEWNLHISHAQLLRAAVDFFTGWVKDQEKQSTSVPFLVCGINDLAERCRPVPFGLSGEHPKQGGVP